MQVVLQGIKGSYSDIACGFFFKNKMKSKGVKNFNEIFSRVCKGQSQYGIVPIENSLTGTLRQNYEYLHEFPVHVVGQIIVAVDHHLLGVEGSKIKHINELYSHPQALQQCDGFIQKHLKDINLHPYFDTAGAAQHVAHINDPQIAALANSSAAKHYGLKILKKSVSDHKKNFTKFFVIKRGLKTSKKDGQQTSLAFRLRSIPGALHKALSIFAIREIDLSRIESVPIQGKPWEYRFFVDVRENLKSQALKNALNNLEEICFEVKVLGNYDIFETSC